MNFLAFWVNDISFGPNESQNLKRRKKFAIKLSRRFCFAGQQMIMVRTLMEQSLRQMGKQEGNYAAVFAQTSLWSFQGIHRIVLPMIRFSLYSTNNLLPGPAKMSHSS